MSSSFADEKEAIRAELEAARREFHVLAGALTPEALKQRSGNPAWTNEQLLFHILLGFLLVPPLWRIMQLFGRLPRGWSGAFSSLLDFSTPLFNFVNARLPRMAARVFRDPAALARQFDRVHRRILALVASAGEAEWGRGMYYPTRWDPRFAEFMTFAELPRFAVEHFRHHRGQLRAPGL